MPLVPLSSFPAASLVAGGCRLTYDVAPIAGRKPPSNSVPFQARGVRTVPSTVIAAICRVDDQGLLPPASFTSPVSASRPGAAAAQLPSNGPEKY